MKLTDLYEGVNDLLKGDKYFYHCVRNDEDIISIFQDGLRSGTNISLTTDGQSFEDEGGTILVFKRSDYQFKSKDYQEDAVITSGSGKPVAIIKDTSVHTKTGFTAEAVEKEWQDLEKKFAEFARSVKKSEDDVRSYSYTMTMRGRERPDWIDQDQFNKLKKLRKEEDDLFAKLDILGEKDEIPSVTVKDVLKRYHIHKVPVYDLPSKFRS